MTEHLRPDGAEQDLAEEIDNIVPSHGYNKIPVVGLGGSAGSIEALQEFFRVMPAGSGLAFVVVIHLSPDHDSSLTELLQRCTPMRVVQANEQISVEPGTVYVIPPGKLIQSANGHLKLSAIGEERARHVTVDVFFRTLADSHAPHSAAVVLSGMDGDGAIGIKRIKERGGLTVAQDPEEALHGSMPRSSVDTGMVDWVLPVRDMPARLLSYFRLEQSINLPPEESPAPAQSRHEQDEAQLRDVLSFLRTRTGRDFSNYKRATVLRRLGRRMQVNGVDNLGSYLTCLRTRSGECNALLQDLLISVTNFFRDAECFEALEAHLPALFAGKKAGDVVRVWTVACATGEEAYSLAMLLSEHARTLDSPPLIQVFATDLDDGAIRTARDGVYPLAITADVSPERLRRHFIKEHRGYRVRRELREMVLFAVHDVLKDSPFSRLDMVSCRNLLIYLTREAQTRVMETVHFGLVPHGKLMLGSSESIDETSLLFQVLDKKHRIYEQRPVGRTSVPLRSAPATLALAERAQQAARDGPIVSSQAGLLSSTEPSAATPGAPGGRLNLAELHLRLVEHLAPPSVLLDADYKILHLSPRAGRFLQFSGGEPSRDLLRAMPAELRIELRAALYQAGQTRGTAELQALPFPLGGSTTLVDVRVLCLEQEGDPLFLVTFDPRIPDAGQVADAAARAETDPLARHLDREIERLKSHLRETVEQYEASTEEIKASNEELQAMNEELRAATEELETSREELQSINEELTTVNQELKNKVEELVHSNSDMQNLMDATAIATIFLNRDLRITRYTPSAGALFNLIPSDAGRPLTDMASQLDYPELGDDARSVLARLVPIEREVSQRGDRWYLARLLPYRTIEDRIGGVVFTFIDITERKKAEEVQRWLSSVVRATSDAVISFAPDHTILSWNGGAERIFGYTAEEAIGQPLTMLAPDGGAEQDRLVANVVHGNGVDNHETVRKRKDGTRIHVAITLSPIRDDDGKMLAGTALARDISSARAAADALRASEERLRLLVESAREYAIFSTDLERRVTSWNSGAERLLGFSESEVMGRSADIIFTPEDRADGAPEREAATALREGRASDERTHMRKDGSRFFGSGAMMAMRNTAGEPVGLVKILRDPSDRPPPPTPAPLRPEC
ncbi:PAS domain S-box protein [Caenimonas sedimenti]|uniref:protein-glutamate O-methyltransferase n=1 Tax=Caenimonas sedimenti TaxID=2596921 RepID=A0A562ZTK5_9BURK|nr:CheR family methyltransferase [Caenimonas sedimenti]TWO71615.1 PAS domain S-box protein [Caenimonas sedimenti]